MIIFYITLAFIAGAVFSDVIRGEHDAWAIFGIFVVIVFTSIGVAFAVTELCHALFL
jgi:hypothetical protein